MDLLLSRRNVVQQETVVNARDPLRRFSLQMLYCCQSAYGCTNLELFCPLSRPGTRREYYPLAYLPVGTDSDYAREPWRVHSRCRATVRTSASAIGRQRRGARARLVARARPRAAGPGAGGRKTLGRHSSNSVHLHFHSRTQPGHTGDETPAVQLSSQSDQARRRSRVPALRGIVYREHGRDGGRGR